MRITNVLGHSFAPDLLRDAKVALDCGANMGGFSTWLSQNTTASVYAFEPDPRLFPNLPILPRVTYVPQAVDGESGSFDLNMGPKMCSSAVYTQRAHERVRVEKTSLTDFCAAHGIHEIDFIKLDIEGAELSVLERTSPDLLTATTQITVEFHDALRASDVPRIRAIAERLKQLGFYFVRFTQFTWGDCLFLNERRVRLTALDKLSIAVSGKYEPGIRRFIKRTLKR